MGQFSNMTLTRVQNAGLAAVKKKKNCRERHADNGLILKYDAHTFEGTVDQIPTMYKFILSTVLISQLPTLAPPAGSILRCRPHVDCD